MRATYRLIVPALLLALLIGRSPAAAQSGATLVVWDNIATDDAGEALIQQLNTQFESDHPGVTVQDQSYSVDTLASALAQGSSALDVVTIQPSQIAALVQAGLLLPLNDYAGQYGWASRYSAPLQLRNSAGDKLYGMSSSAEMVGLFYNRDLFGSLGLEVPGDWDTLAADLDTIQSSGLIPISFAGADPDARVDTLSALALAYSDIGDVNALIARSPDASFLTEGDLDGAQTFVDWIDAGYFSHGFGRIDPNAALAEFTGGKSALWLASTSNSGQIGSAMGDHAGFFLLPSPIGDPVAPTVGGLGATYVIPASSTHADLAAQYLDFMSGSSAAAVLLDNKFLPASAVDPATLQPGTLMADLVSAWATVTAANELGAPLDQSIPDIAARIQALAAKQITPEQFVDDVEQAYEAGS